MANYPSSQSIAVILDSIADGVFTVNSEWRITSFNRAAETILGIPREEAMGKPCCEVFRSSICETQCALKETINTGKSIINKTIFVINVKGERIPISISTAILRNAKGELIGGVETFRDLSQLEELQKKLYEKYSFTDIIGRSLPMRKIFDILPQIAQSDATVLLVGESGTGKELFARAIHNLSTRRKHEFVAVNCAALPDTLLESELFGYKAGAFTDAKKEKPGRFAIADRGTVFLDEIGDISPAMQTRLLRVLQERIIEPLGATKPVPVNVRVITATNKDLAKYIRKGLFREDLYYRIHVIRIEIPPLRNRKEDVPLLIRHFLSKFNRLYNKDITDVSDSVMVVLMAHDFPGNVRELENILEHAVVLCPGGLVELHHLPPDLLPGEHPMVSGNHRLSLKELEKMHITNAIQQCNGNRTAAAKALGIHPSTLFRKIAYLGLELPDQDGRHRNK
ncbi:MAG: PAS domain-containing protein [Candidatus Omnitrophota bacterium]|jgi:PAS domain S-box-containing protein|nr:MAG: PAS domain-containing protein [Candidatus Omnitrophota bacterium]